MESRLEWQLLSAFVDNSLDEPRRRPVEQRIASDPDLSEELRRLRLICSAVRLRGTRHTAPLPLVVHASRLMWTGSHRAGSAWSAIDWPRWFAWWPVAMAACIASLSAWIDHRSDDRN